MMLNFELFLLETLHPIIDPKTNKPFRADRKLEQIKRFVNNSGIPLDDLWLSFSDLPKLGAKPGVRTNKTTPHGVFGFPMRYYLSKKGEMPYASDRTFIIIFKVKGKILEVGHDNSKIRKLEKDPRVKSHVDYLKSIRTVRFNYTNFYEEIDDLLRQNSIFNKSNRNFQQLIFNRLRTSRGEYPDSLQEAISDLQKRIFNLSNWENNDINQINIDRFKSELGEFSFYNIDAGEYEEYFINYNVEKNQYRLNPNYIRYLIEKKNPVIKPTMYNVYVNKIFKIEDLELIVPEVYQSYKARVLDKKYYENINYIRFILNHIKKKSFEPIYLKYGPKKNNTNVRPKLPMEDQLIQICKELGISLDEAYKNMSQDENRVVTPSQILYKITKYIAKLSASKNPPNAYAGEGKGIPKGYERSPNPSWYQQRWNEILRKLGFAGVIDSKDTGQVHSHEPTQGAFVDPSKIEIVNIIHNKSGQYRNPKDMTWDDNISKHIYSYPVYLRNGIFPGTESEKKIQALNQKLDQKRVKFINSISLTLKNLFKKGEDSNFENAYKEAVGLLNQITFYKLAFSKEIKEDESKYEDELKSNGGDSYGAMYAVKDKKTSYQGQITSSFKKLNSIKGNVFEKLNVFFKYVKYDGNEFWVKTLKALARELDNPSKIILNKRIIPEKISFSIFKKENEEKQTYKLSEIPLPEQPEDSRIEKDLINLQDNAENLGRQTRRAIDSIFYGYTTDMMPFNRAALNVLNLIIKIRVYHKEELENQKEEYLKDEGGVNYWRQIKTILKDTSSLIDRLIDRSPHSPWAAWYQLATLLKEITKLDEDTNIGDVKHIQYNTDLPDEESVSASVEVPDGQGKTFEFYDKPKSSEPEKSKDELAQKSSDDLPPLELDDEDDLPPLELSLDDEDEDELELSLDDEDEDDNPFK
jgi:hypothetical protein